MLETWVRTVPRPMYRASAISGFDLPTASRRNTSTSRGEGRRDRQATARGRGAAAASREDRRARSPPLPPSPWAGRGQRRTLARSRRRPGPPARRPRPVRGARARTARGAPAPLAQDGAAPSKRAAGLACRPGRRWTPTLDGADQKPGVAALDRASAGSRRIASPRSAKSPACWLTMPRSFSLLPIPCCSPTPGAARTLPRSRPRPARGPDTHDPGADVAQHVGHQERPGLPHARQRSPRPRRSPRRSGLRLDGEASERARPPCRTPAHASAASARARRPSASARAKSPRAQTSMPAPHSARTRSAGGASPSMPTPA